MSTVLQSSPRSSSIKAGRFRDGLRLLGSNKLTVVGLIISLLVVIMIIAAPYLAPFPPDRISLSERLVGPSFKHLFGTDEVGRDILSRVIFGSRASCGIAFAIVAISCVLGTIIGCMSGVAGGVADRIIMRIMDVFLALPALVLAMAVAAALGPSLINAMMAVAIVRVPAYVRLARGQTLGLRNRLYVKASRSFGASNAYLLRWHIVPNALSPIIVQATLDLGATMLTAAALSFIGLGAQPPTSEWGAMVSSGRNHLLDNWWYATFPGFAILVSSMGFNLLGDGLRDIMDPRLSR